MHLFNFFKSIFLIFIRALARDADVGLHLGGVGAIVGREMVSGLHGAVSIPKREAVSVGDGEESRKGILWWWSGG